MGEAPGFVFSVHYFISCALQRFFAVLKVFQTISFAEMPRLTNCWACCMSRGSGEILKFNSLEGRFLAFFIIVSTLGAK